MDWHDFFIEFWNYEYSEKFIKQLDTLEGKLPKPKYLKNIKIDY